MVTSHLTGWNPNPLMLFRAAGATLDDPRWVNMGNPTHDATSFNSQPTYVVSFTPSSGSPYFVYMADNWVRRSANIRNRPPRQTFSSVLLPRRLSHLCARRQPQVHGGPKGLIDAAYVWLPLHFGTHDVTLERREEWDLDKPFGQAVENSPFARGGMAGEISN